MRYLSKKNIIDNVKLAEAYFLYDELSKNKGISNNILDDYVNESIEIIKKIVVSEKSKINEVNIWISENLSKSATNPTGYKKSPNNPTTSNSKWNMPTGLPPSVNEFFNPTIPIAAVINPTV
jgi:hypothetical protein